MHQSHALLKKNSRIILIIVIQTRKHSSRMHTAHLPTVCVVLTTTRYQHQGVGIPGPMSAPSDIPVPLLYPPPVVYPSPPQKGPGTKHTHTPEQKDRHITFPQFRWQAVEMPLYVLRSTCSHCCWTSVVMLRILCYTQNMQWRFESHGNMYFSGCGDF